MNQNITYWNFENATERTSTIEDVEGLLVYFMEKYPKDMKVTFCFPMTKEEVEIDGEKRMKFGYAIKDIGSGIHALLSDNGSLLSVAGPTL